MEKKIFEHLTAYALFPHCEHFIAYPLLKKYDYPWEALGELGEFICRIGMTLSPEEYNIYDGNVYISRQAKIAPTASVSGPCIICEGATLRHSAYIRGNVIVGKNATVGNSTELKNAILFDSAQAPHFNYVGDSILGYKAHIGAGTVCSNLKSDGSEISVIYGNERIPTSRRKLGAMLGDLTEIGCGCVLNPGTVIGCETTVYPLISVRGYVSNNVIFKSINSIIEKV